MATLKRHKTDHPGVFYIVAQDGEKIYYIRYRRDGKMIEEKAGKQRLNDMTPARARDIRADRSRGKEPSNTEKRRKALQKDTEWTIGRLWQEYVSQIPGGINKTDRSRWELYLEPAFSSRKPEDLLKLDTDRLRIKLLKTKAPQTVKHILSLLRRIVNFGADQGHTVPLTFKITMPKVDNRRTEDLTPEEINRLLKVLDETHYTTVASIMKVALYTGMRSGEILKLKWTDIDALRGFILIRDPKGGRSQKIPLNASAKAVFESIPANDSEYLFPGKKGGHRQNIYNQAIAIKKQAGLPEDFRPMHGLRHLFATMLASSGKVDMFTLQKLLTHKTPGMTQRYAHLRDEALKKASNQIDDIFAEVKNA